MAKKAVNRKQRKEARKQKRRTNWILIGSVIALGVMILAALTFLTLREQTPAQLADYCAANLDNCIIKGSPSAPVTFVEVSDYGCGHCRDFNLETADTLREQYVDSGQVRWITLPFAFRGQAGNYPTLPSAAAALCANEQGQYSEYSKGVFALQGTPLFNTRAGFVQVAESLGMDVDALNSCLDSNRYQDVIIANTDAAMRAGLRGTPAFFVNGLKFEGNFPLSVFQQRIDSALGGSS